MRISKKKVITALDIGTTKICAIISAINEDGELEVRGIGSTPSEGLSRGIVKNIEKASESIKKALEKAELNAEMKAQNIYAGIAGDHIRSFNAIGRISIPDSKDNESTEITREDVKQVLNSAKRTIEFEKGHDNLEIIHAIPQYYEVDNETDIFNPVNMNGYYLTAHVHVVLADSNALRNLRKCIELAGYHEHAAVLEPIASSFSVLDDNERKLGCILLDIGSGTTDISVFFNESIRFSNVKAVGGDNVTSDLYIVLRTTPYYAEELKIKHGNALPETISEDEMVTLEGIGGRVESKQPLRKVSEIIEPRMREILDVAYRTVFSNFKQNMITAGLVLTGGTALLHNADKLAEEIFNMPVKIGYPDLKRLQGATAELNSPIFATSVGLLYYALEELEEERPVTDGKTKTYKRNFKDSFKSVFKKITDYV
ncbi:MAG: cell division protein FtsA [Candidatus Cloacimonetes bacterium]|nr:cell division protein FtsA [Candidatus Cloacimonadota bacterium]